MANLVEPQGVELGLFLDAGVQLQDLSDCHGGVGGGRQGKLHPQSPVLSLYQTKRRQKRQLLKLK